MVQTNSLKGLFVERGLSYAEVAKAIGVSESTMNRRMKSHIFGSDEIQKLIELLGISQEKATSIFFPDSHTKDEAL